MDEATRQDLIQRYRSGVAAVEEALAGLDEPGLDARSGPEEWSPREVVHHLADSEMRSALRLRQLLAEDQPRIQGYDEATYARRLHYDRPIDASLAAFRAARETSAQLIERMEPADWSRQGTHEEHGTYTPETWLEIYASHAHDHAGQIRSARGSG